MGNLVSHWSVPPIKPVHRSPHANPSVSALYANALDAYLGERGFPLHPTSAEIGPGASSQRVGGHDYAHMLTMSARELDDPALGLQFGTRVGAAGFGMLGIAAATALTLREAIVHLTQLESITSTLGRARAELHGDTVSVVWDACQAVPPVVVEGILSGWVSFGRFLLGEKVDIKQVSFTHGAHGPVRAYEDALDCPVRFDSTSYRVTIGADLLDARPRFANHALNGALKGWLGHCAAGNAVSGKSLTRQISTIIGGAIALDQANEQHVAQSLGMGVRTMQRILRGEGSSFREILNAARAHHGVIHLLRGQVSLCQLSADVGFDEQSSFCRAFQRWTGSSPLVLKRDLAQLFQPLRHHGGELDLRSHDAHRECQIEAG